MQVRPRSGLALKHGISLPNAPGTIDSDYRGPLGVILVNLGDERPSSSSMARASRRRSSRRWCRPGSRFVEQLDETVAGCGRLRVDRGRLMLLVAGLAAMIWGIGAAMGVPRAARLNMLGLLYVAVLALQVALPEGHPLREATGGSPALWLIIGAGVLLVLAYRLVLNRLRGRAERIEATRETDAGAAEAGSVQRYRAGALCAAHHASRYRGRRAAGAEAGRVLVVGAGVLGRRRFCISRRRGWGGSGSSTVTRSPCRTCSDR
jgi:hypothetical protein